MTDIENQLRLRVFTGPDGSGKSTIIESVRNYKANEKHVDFGFYINADVIAQHLREGSYSFEEAGITTNASEFTAIAAASGLLENDFTINEFASCYTFDAVKVTLNNNIHLERLAQIIADFLRKKLLEEKKRFSFETVFSHPSKLNIMREAQAAGYKVYLYFVSTKSPEINRNRVKSRAVQGGHDVPVDKIESRYYRSLDLLYGACQIAYQTLFFDNSEVGKESVLFAHFKVESGEKKWDIIQHEKLPDWFYKYYIEKVNGVAE